MLILLLVLLYGAVAIAMSLAIAKAIRSVDDEQRAAQRRTEAWEELLSNRDTEKGHDMSDIWDEMVQSVRMRGFHHESASEFVAAEPGLWAEFAHFVQEVGELSRAMRNDTPLEAQVEWADCVIALTSIAPILGIENPDEIIREKLAADEGRGWQHSGEDAPGLFDEEWEHVTEPGVTHWALNGKAPADNGTQGV